MKKNIYILDNVLNEYEVKSAYNLLVDQNWKIDSVYEDKVSSLYPTFVVNTEDKIFNHYWYGFFIGVVTNVNRMLREQYKFDLGSYKITGILLNAQQNKGGFHFHTHKGSYSLVGFLTRYWKDDWGGELQIEDQTIKFKPGSFVLSKTDDLHDAMPVRVDLPFWRISVGIFLECK
jgi:hypothetical protein